MRKVLLFHILHKHIPSVEFQRNILVKIFYLIEVDNLLQSLCVTNCFSNSENALNPNTFMFVCIYVVLYFSVEHISTVGQIKRQTPT